LTYAPEPVFATGPGARIAIHTLRTRQLLIAGAAAACLLAAASLHAADTSLSAPPAWAYPINPPATHAPPADEHAVRHVPGSRAIYTTAQVGDLFVVPDWHPEDHPPAPAVVTQGRAPDVYPCGHCHRMTGPGGPENARLAGLPAAYILQQLDDYRHGLRTTAVANRVPPTYMIRIAKALTPQEMTAAAQYFSALAPKDTIRVIETAKVPRTHVVGWRLEADAGGAQEAIGHRIIEIPDVPEDFESRDTRATFTAYVPPGSLARGNVLANSGGNSMPVACSVCHGAQLRGLGIAPPIAGRSPSYLMRQLYEIQSGSRAGPNVAPMKVAIAALTPDDLLAAAAWAASLQ
jgi:cytochrome c553